MVVVVASDGDWLLITVASVASHCVDGGSLYWRCCFREWFQFVPPLLNV